MVISWVSIWEMTCLHPLRARTNKGKKYKGMNVTHELLARHAQSDEEPPSPPTLMWFQPAPGGTNPRRVTEASVYKAKTRPHRTVIANTITRKADRIERTVLNGHDSLL